MDPIELVWKPTWGDTAEAVRNARGVRRLRVFGALIVLMAVGEILLGAPLLGAPIIVLGLLAAALPETQAFLTFRRTPMATAERDVVIDDSGVRMDSALTQAHHGWSDLCGWKESRRSFLLRVSSPRSGAAVLLPKRALTAEGVERLRARLAERVGSAGAATQEPEPAPAPAAAAPNSTSGDPINLSWTPAQRDWVEGFRTVSLFHRWSRVICLVAVLTGILVFVFTSGSGSTAFTVVFGCVVMVPIGAVLWFVTELQVRSLFRRNELVRAPKDATVDVAGLHFTSEGSTSLLSWDAFADWQENAGSFVLRSGKGAYTPVVLLPKRGLLEPATVEQLRATLERNLALSPKPGQ